jgi:HlyD family secretion protein
MLRRDGNYRLALLMSLFALTGCGAEETSTMTVYRIEGLRNRDVVVSANAAGSVEPIQTVEIKSKASGEIVSVAVEVGDLVSQGDVLVRVDRRVPLNAVVQAEADLRVANAELANAEAQLVRAEALHESRVITQEEWENTRLAFATAEAQQIRAERTLQDARIAYEDTEVRAASHGVILSRQVEVGTVIQSASFGLSGGAVLLTMANLDTVQVRTLVNEADVGKIAPGMPATIKVEAYPSRQFRGEVLKIEPLAFVQWDVTMFPVLIRIDNEEGLLKPGMNAEVEIHIADLQDVLAIPNTALRTEDDVELAASVLGLDMATVSRQLESAAVIDEMSPNWDASAADALEALTLESGLATDGEAPASEASAVSSNNPGGKLAEDVSVTSAGVLAGRSGYQFGGDYVVFVLRGGLPVAVRVLTGVTDLEYSQVLAGLSPGDSVFILPSAALVREQQRRQERATEETQILGGNR